VSNHRKWREEALHIRFVFERTEPGDRLGFEKMNMDDYEIFQMPVKDIATKTGLVFNESITQADELTEASANESIPRFKGRRIRSLESILRR
jgi:hypothetical protein